jgi:hypothetical protein
MPGYARLGYCLAGVRGNHRLQSRRDHLVDPPYSSFAPDLAKLDDLIASQAIER